MKALRTDGKWLRDREGRIVLLRGVNCGGDAKDPPFAPFPREEGAAQIASWGLDAVRYTAFWEAAEPAEGRWDDAYLARMEEIVGWLTARGLFVFVDMHQDLFARKLRGSGAPAWACAEDPAGLPHPEGGPEWFMNYTAPPVARAFTRFWSDDGLQAHFCETLRRIAARFAGNPRVVGYELFNEPWHGGFDFASGAFERERLAPFYERAAAAVRSEDPDALIFVEPALLCGGLFTMQSRLPRLRAPGVVYAPHYYSLDALTGREARIDRAIRDIERDLDLVAAKAEELAAPAILGEFGAHPAQQDGARIVEGYYRALDARLMGGTIWCYAPRDTWNGEGVSLVGPDLAERPYVEAVVRAYPMAVAGEPTRIAYDPPARRLRLEWRGADVAAPTLVAAPARLYPRGPAVRASGGRHEWDRARGILAFEAAGEGGCWLEIDPAG